jgi:hypothetical protein
MEMLMRKKDHLFAILILIAAMLACNLPARQVQATPPPMTEADVIVEPTLLQAGTPLPPTAESTLTSEPSPTSQVVMITASGGNINIRRGPGVGYNPIAVFENGQSAVATARNADGSWLNISFPGGSGQSGWVNAKTPYSSVTGEINLLPVISVAAPEPAYIRNCTFHVMLIQPGGTKVKAQTDSPDNKLQFNPGNYEVFDTSVDGKKPMKTIKLREGDTIEIIKDGLENSYPCP